MMAPYIALLRLDKPIGIWLLYFPAAWAVALSATHGLGYFLLLMLVGAVVTRSAGCIINDLADRRLDALVARTRGRPLASGQIPVWQAYLLLFALLGIALGIALSLPRAVLILALLAVPMIVAYPWMKRITWWPQLFLGLTFNLSALFGWLATGADMALAAVTLYIAGIFWTLGYDTIYAMQDMADDALAGIKSTARMLGPYRRIFIASCYGMMVFFLAVTGMLVGTGTVYYLGVVLVAAHATWQVRQLGNKHAGMLFRSNQWLGLTLLVILLLDRAVL